VKARALHSWDVNTVEARDIQRRLASEVVRLSPLDKDSKLVAGVDLSPPDQDGRARGAAVVVRLPDMEIVEVKIAEATPKMPYIPGLLSFRESPPILAALEKLTTVPDFVLGDGQP
jgi:deoxyribonuclease V